MNRRFISTRKFDKQIKMLDKKTQKQAAKAMEFFIKDLTHFSLRFKRIQGTDNFFEISVNMSIRIIVELKESNNDQINTFYIIGKHEDVLPPK
ncbi:MAG: addiction module toxin RelE [Bacillota bacterium]|nr:addiction module toxin RelE [Bacillota bacterium]